MVEKAKNKESFLDSLGLGKFGDELKKLKDKILGFFGIEVDEAKKEAKAELDDLKKGSIENYRKLFDSIKDRVVGDISMEFVDDNKFVKVEYQDKDGGKVWGMIPSNWNGKSNIYMPGDRSRIGDVLADGAENPVRGKGLFSKISKKFSKKAWFIFEGDASKIDDGTEQSARYNGVVSNFSAMTEPMRSKGKIKIIGHSRAGSAINGILAGNKAGIDSVTLLDATYGTYNNVINAAKNGLNVKINYLAGGTTEKYIKNYKGYSNIKLNKLSGTHEGVAESGLTDGDLYA